MLPLSGNLKGLVEHSGDMKLIADDHSLNKYSDFVRVTFIQPSFRASCSAVIRSVSLN